MKSQIVMWQFTLRSWMKKRLSREEFGASLVEYALLLGLVSVVAIGALVFLGHTVNNTLQNVGNTIAGAS